MVENSVIKLMVIDDDPFILKLTRRVLSNLGYDLVTTLESGQAALEHIDSLNNSPDIILLDLNMPEMDGIEFVRHLVDRDFIGSLILLSGEDERTLQTVGQLVKLHNLSTLGHLQKPVNPEQLARLLNRWSPHTSTELKTNKKTYTEERLRSAIFNGELVNYYQPKVDIRNGKVIGVETLVRWQHPLDKLVFPDQFIGLAEKYNLIDALTEFVVKEAFLQLKAWKNENIDISLSLNLSMINLASLEFINFVVAAANAAGITSDDIVLELTESQLMKKASVPLEILTRLRLKRFLLSIDDFGTGHSSLKQLRDIPFQELKIDKSFVHGAANNETLHAIFNSCLNLAHQLGMTTVAEGVEDRTDWDFLRTSGCDLAQGYFIARPMPASDIPAWIRDWEANLANLC